MTSYDLRTGRVEDVSCSPRPLRLRVAGGQDGRRRARRWGPSRSRPEGQNPTPRAHGPGYATCGQRSRKENDTMRLASNDLAGLPRHDRRPASASSGSISLRLHRPTSPGFPPSRT
jgi:hypothetical protein